MVTNGNLSHCIKTPSGCSTKISILKYTHVHFMMFLYTFKHHSIFFFILKEFHSFIYIHLILYNSRCQCFLKTWTWIFTVNKQNHKWCQHPKRFLVHHPKWCYTGRLVAKILGFSLNLQHTNAVISFRNESACKMNGWV